MTLQPETIELLDRVIARHDPEGVADRWSIERKVDWVLTMLEMFQEMYGPLTLGSAVIPGGGTVTATCHTPPPHISRAIRDRPRAST